MGYPYDSGNHHMAHYQPQFFRIVSWNGRYPNNGWFIGEDSIQMGDLGGTPILGNIHICTSYALGIHGHCLRRYG